MIAEMIIDTDTATANCLYSCPVMPGIKAVGTNTESRTRVIAMIGAVTCDIAFSAASAGVK